MDSPEAVLASEIKPGSYLVVRTSSLFGYLIRWVTHSPFDHAFVYVGDGQIVEATTWGVRLDQLASYGGHQAAVNAAEEMTETQRAQVVARARSYAGWLYNWPDIGGIALRRLGVKWGWLSSAESHALICSELVCLSGEAAGLAAWQCHEPDPAYVTPADLAARKVMRPAGWD